MCHGEFRTWMVNDVSIFDSFGQRHNEYGTTERSCAIHNCKALWFYCRHEMDMLLSRNTYLVRTGMLAVLVRQHVVDDRVTCIPVDFEVVMRL